LVKTANNYFAREHGENNRRIFPLSITDIELTTILWLKAFKKQSGLSELALMQYAHASINPPTKFIEMVKNRLESMKMSDTEGASLLERSIYDKYTKAKLFEVTGGSIEKAEAILDTEYKEIKEWRKDKSKMQQEYDQLKMREEQRKRADENRKNKLHDRVSVKAHKKTKCRIALVLGAFYILMIVSVVLVNFFINSKSVSLISWAVLVLLALEFTVGYLMPTFSTSIRKCFAKKWYEKLYKQVMQKEKRKMDGFINF